MRIWNYGDDGNVYYYWEDGYYSDAGAELLILLAVFMFVGIFMGIRDLFVMGRNNPYAED